jgi:hypothetical protein
MATQVAGGAKVDLPACQTRKLVFHGHYGETRDMARFEFDQDIDVAVRTEIVPEDRAEKGEFYDMVPSAEIR